MDKQQAYNKEYYKANKEDLSKKRSIKYKQKKEIKMNAYAIFLKMNKNPQEMENKPLYSEYKKIHDDGCKIYSLIKAIFNKDLASSKEPIQYLEGYKNKFIAIQFKQAMTMYSVQGLEKTLIFIKNTLTIND